MQKVMGRTFQKEGPTGGKPQRTSRPCGHLGKLLHDSPLRGRTPHLVLGHVLIREEEGEAAFMRL